MRPSDFDLYWFLKRPIIPRLVIGDSTNSVSSQIHVYIHTCLEHEPLGAVAGHQERKQDLQDQVIMAADRHDDLD